MSLIGWTLIPAIPLASAFVERFGRPGLAMLASFTVIGVGLVVLPFASGVGLLAAFALIVLGMGVPPGLIMALPAQALRPETRAGGMGVYYTWYYAAMAILPTGAGLARDYSGSAAAPMAFAAAERSVRWSRSAECSTSSATITSSSRTLSRAVTAGWR